jgi:UDP-glucose 4-epimerase
VIPRFVEQIQNGEQMTITSPHMTRFLMSLAESVDLVTYAFTQASSGDLFVRKAPAATITTIAQAVAELMGVETDFRIIGIRHGEKLYESLLSAEEMSVADDRGDYFRVPLDGRDLNYAEYFEEGQPRREVFVSYTSESTQQLDLESVKKLLRSLPEMQRVLGS